MTYTHCGGISAENRSAVCKVLSSFRPFSSTSHKRLCGCCPWYLYDYHGVVCTITAEFTPQPVDVCWLFEACLNEFQIRKRALTVLVLAGPSVSKISLKPLLEIRAYVIAFPVGGKRKILFIRASTSTWRVFEGGMRFYFPGNTS